MIQLVRWSSTGSLWLAEAVDADRRVLFKLVHPRLTRDARRTALYASAAHVVIGIRNEHLVAVLDVKVRDGDVLVVAQATDGSILSGNSRLEPEQLATVAGDTAEGLAALHAQQVSHLDVRPEKVLLDADGRARLIDLGSGRVRASLNTRAASHDDRLTFVAPEQIVARDHGPAADVYSLGLTLWAFAGGELQRMGTNPAAQASYRLMNDVPPLEASITGLSEQISRALAEATRRRADQRPTAAELVELLRGH